MAPHVSGPIVELPIHDNQHIRKGALLFVVDPRPYQAALERAEASLTLTNLQIDALQDAIHSNQARQHQLEADAAYDKQYLNRIVPLLARHFVTANDVFNARRKSAEAALYDAKLNVQYCYVRAPFDAYVTNLNIAVGQYANEGRQVVSLVDNRVWYVIANFRENFLDHIRPGMRVEVYLLSYPNQRFAGRVQEAGWALYQDNGATVAGLPRVEPTLNWVRLSQRFPVRIVLESRDRQHPFRMGQTAVVTVQGFR